jgi:hypothetical protein
VSQRVKYGKIREANTEHLREMCTIIRQKLKLHRCKLESEMWTFHPRISNRKEA